MERRKIKNGEKSPRGQCLTRPAPNGRRRSGFWLVPEKHKRWSQSCYVFVFAFAKVKGVNIEVIYLVASLMRVKGEVKANTIFGVFFEGPQCAVNPVFRAVRDGLSQKGTIFVRNYIPNSASQVKNQQPPGEWLSCAQGRPVLLRERPLRTKLRTTLCQGSQWTLSQVWLP